MGGFIFASSWWVCYRLEPTKRGLASFGKGSAAEAALAKAREKLGRLMTRVPVRADRTRLLVSLAESSLARNVVRPITIPLKLWCTYSVVRSPPLAQALHTASAFMVGHAIGSFRFAFKAQEKQREQLQKKAQQTEEKSRLQRAVQVQRAQWERAEAQRRKDQGSVLVALCKKGNANIYTTSLLPWINRSGLCVISTAVPSVGTTFFSSRFALIGLERSCATCLSLLLPLATYLHSSTSLRSSTTPSHGSPT